MRRKNQSNQIVRESLTQALLLLMQSQPFAQINITQIVEKAGVSRVSFYRNFQSKDDVLLSYLNELAGEWWSTFPKDRGDYLLGLLEHCMTIRDTILLLYRQGLAPLLWQNLRELIGPAAETDRALSYQKSGLVGCLFGILSEWVRSGMEDSPETVAQLFDAAQIDRVVLHLRRT